jgi:hypothetical protein
MFPGELVAVSRPGRLQRHHGADCARDDRRRRDAVERVEELKRDVDEALVEARAHRGDASRARCDRSAALEVRRRRSERDDAADLGGEDGQVAGGVNKGAAAAFGTLDRPELVLERALRDRGARDRIGRARRRRDDDRLALEVERLLALLEALLDDHVLRIHRQVVLLRQRVLVALDMEARIDRALIVVDLRRRARVDDAVVDDDHGGGAVLAQRNHGELAVARDEPRRAGPQAELEHEVSEPDLLVEDVAPRARAGRGVLQGRGVDLALRDARAHAPRRRAEGALIEARQRVVGTVAALAEP